MSQIEQLRNHLRAEERRRRAWAAGDWLVAGATAVLLLLLLFVALDAAWPLPRGGVLAAWVLMLAAALGGVGGAAIAGWRRESAAATALRLERAHPELPRNALINSLQVAETGGPGGPPLAERVLTEAAWQLSPPRLPPPLRLRRNGGLSLSGALVLGMAWLLAPASVNRSFQRLLSPGREVPLAGRLTLREVRPGDAVVRPGDSLAVTVDLWGDAPAAAAGARLEVRGVNRSDAPAALVWSVTGEQWPGRGAGRAGIPLLRGETRIPQIYQPCEYRVAAAEATSRWHRVTVAAPPALANWSAEVEPPAYLQRRSYRLLPDRQAGGSVPVGATVHLRLEADQPLQALALRVNRTAVAAETSRVAGAAGDLRFHAALPGSVEVTLAGSNGLSAHAPLPWSVVADAPPRMQLLDVPARQTVPPHAGLGLPFQARDDAGLAATGVEALVEGQTAWRTVETRPVPDGVAALDGRHTLPVASLGLKPGQRASLRLFAEDGRPQAALARGYSRIIELRLEEAASVADRRQQQRDAAVATLAGLLLQQKDNLRGTERLLAHAQAGNQLPNAPILALRNTQDGIREQARELLRAPENLGETALALAAVEKKEMAAAVERLAAAAQGGVARRAAELGRAVETQRLILAKLTTAQQGAGQEALHEQRRDLLSLYRKLCSGQQENLTATGKVAGGQAAGQVTAASLAKAEDALVALLSAFQEVAAASLQAEAANPEDGFADTVKAVRDLLRQRAVYEAMVLAAESLEQAEWPLATTRQQDILKTLREGLDRFNRWNVKNAQHVVDRAEKQLQDVAKLLEGLETQQRGIVEATRELGRQQQSPELSPETRDKLKEMDQEQAKMKELLEKFANDLFQFPELPVSGEINGKLREIYEDVQQAMDSANAPSLEIAVQKEDALLDAIRATKERVKDVEMWLPDVPDNIVWNMESFDTDEIPDIPLVPLPDTLEDIVGDLLEQAAEIDAQSQDTTGNNLIADGEMGWAVMDGPMPSFGAKGKSGNTKPNDNEMTGRSGAGREGQATGEVVEKSIKGLEGRETNARFTKDPLQSGQLEEEEGSTLDARSTGGGKLGGESESMGLFGQAPRRDLTMADHARKVTPLRQETEALYSKARLLYLESGGLAQAAQGLREMEGAPSLPAYGALSRKVVRHLQGSQVELAAGTALPMEVTETAAAAVGRNVFDLDLGQIQDEAYRSMIKAFYERLGQPAAP